MYRASAINEEMKLAAAEAIRKPAKDSAWMGCCCRLRWSAIYLWQNPSYPNRWIHRLLTDITAAVAKAAIDNWCGPSALPGPLSLKSVADIK